MKTKTFMPLLLAIVALLGFSAVAQANENTVYGSATVRPDTITDGPYEVEYTPTIVNGVGLNDVVVQTNPTVATYNASRVGATTAQLNGYYDMGALLTTGVIAFEYGTSKNNMSYGTSPTTIHFYENSDSYARTIAGLTKETTYYYRLVGRYAGKEIYGEIKSFTTTDGASVSETPVSGSSTATGTATGNSNSVNSGTNATGSSSNAAGSGTATNTNGGSGSTNASSSVSTTYARLSITDNKTRIERGDEVTYTVTYEARQALRDANLRIELPDGVTILRASRGIVDKSDSAVVIDLGDLSSGSKRTIEIDARMNSSYRDGRDITSTAELSFETSNGSTRSATATDTTEFVGGSSGLGASIFGTNVGLSFFNWLLIAGIIAIIIILARKQFQKA